MDDIKVSVLCTVYNQDKYLERCIESLINQKTKFKYEILINDDCSTDDSRTILNKYEKKYPNLMKVIYQTENQFSKGVSISNDILFPISKGKYIAFCEGDDCWCDENKLQVQYDFMEKHIEAKMCVHNTQKNDLLTGEKRLFNDYIELHKLTEEEVFLKWICHTSSFFIRREFWVVPHILDFNIYGDFQRLTYCFCNGEVYCIPKVMSIYNYNNTNGVMIRNSKNIKKLLNHYDENIKYLDTLASLVDNKYKDIINRRKVDDYLQIISIMMEKENVKKCDYYQIRNYILKNKTVKKVAFLQIKRNSFIKKTMLILALSNYCFFRILSRIKKEIKK